MPASRFFLAVLSLAATANGATTAYVTTTAQTISVFDAALGAEQTPILIGPDAGQVVFSHDGSSLYAFTNNNITQIDVVSHLTLRRFPASIQINSIALSPDGQTIYYAGQSPKVFAMDISSGAVRGTLTIPTATSVECLALSNDGSTLYMSYGTLPGFIPCVASVVTPKYSGTGIVAATTSPFHLTHFFISTQVNGEPFALTPDGKAVIVGSGFQVTRYNSATAQIEQTTTTSAYVSTLAVTPDGTGLLVALTGGPLLLLDPVTLALVNQDPSIQANFLAFSPDGTTCYFLNIALLPSPVASFSIAEFGAVTHQQLLPRTPLSIAVSPADGSVYVTNLNAASLSFDADTGALGGFVETWCCEPLVPNNGGKLAYDYYTSPGIQVFHAGKPLPVANIALSASNASASGFALSLDGRTGFAAVEGITYGEQVAIAIVDMHSGVVKRTMPIKMAGPLTLFSTVSADGSILYFAQNPGIGGPSIISAESVATGKITQITLLAGGIPLLLPSPDSKYVYVNTFENMLSKLDAKTLTPVASLTFPPGSQQLGQLNLEPSGKYLYGVIFDQTTQVSELIEIDAASLTVTRTLPGLPLFYTFAVTPNATRAYALPGSQSMFGSMFVIDLTSFQLLPTIPILGTGEVLSMPAL